MVNHLGVRFQVIVPLYGQWRHYLTQILLKWFYGARLEAWLRDVFSGFSDSLVDLVPHPNAKLLDQVETGGG